ncbi:hypothetical protein N7468_005779, partial [Penicillium chermesinum]
IMNSGNESWHSGGGPPSHPSMDQMNQQPRPLGPFSQNPSQAGPPSQSSGPVLPPPARAMGLPTNLHHTHNTLQAPPHGSGHSLPGIGQAMQHASPQSLNRERERDSREREIMERERQRQEEMAHRERERERAEQMERERQHHPVQSHPGNVQSSGGPASLFGTPMQQHGDGTPRPYMQHPAGPPMMGGYTGSGQQIPGNVAALAQGQQPILNASHPTGPQHTQNIRLTETFHVQDALSYLDQVKVRFVDQPDVYNRFLDIMKDFKSQAIDTPGVIQRVSTLFNGHPALIQGFNTFLPPGYRIECGTEDNPDAIRVTTPSGTNTLSMPRAGRPLEPTNEMGPSSSLAQHSRPDYYEQSRPGWQQNQQQPSQQQTSGSYSPGSRMISSMYQPENQGSAQEHPYAYQNPESQGASALSRPQDHRGVAQLQGAASAASGLGRGSMMSTSNAGQNASLTQSASGLAGLGGMLQGGHPDLNKRGPVEFNHAISYVNKIKNRFSSAPEIYKQFLEILQTYQRESKPIQDVYAQVTQLFNTAPDLLEDFKQFLPESAAHAKQQAAQAARLAEESIPMSNMRGDSIGHPSQTPNRDMKNMPPMGNFNVKDSGKESKKRRGGPGGGSISGPAGVDVRLPESSLRGQPPQFGNKRTKYTHGKTAGPADIPNASPTLVPALPEPIPPSVSATPSQEEIAFFDRVKKFIANKQLFSEFVKLCSLYTSDLIDRFVLAKRAEKYIGSNVELMNWFQRFLNAEHPEDRIIDPKPTEETDGVNLSRCRALGPSYRLLPFRDRHKPCSGRDQLCREVLNDEWASHPTWHSEDSGFIAHRKNGFEDSLHRIEEDRHDYDHHIEACTRTIQLMEPICQQFLHMSESERANFQLPRGLGGQSEAIYQRVIKKVYDRQRGEKIIRDMFARPCQVTPIVLYRLKQKLEEWKACQREWDKVWREQMQRSYWRSLDHQAIATRSTDKKLFIAKVIQQDLQAKFEETQISRKNGLKVPNHQAEMKVQDIDVLLDATHLLCMFMDRTNSGFGAEPSRLINFVKDFIPIFFGLDRETFHDYMDELSAAATPAEELEDNFDADDVSNTSRKGPNMQKLAVLREALERREPKSSSKEDGPTATQAPQVSQQPTPDGLRALSSGLSDSGEAFDAAELKWMEHPGQGNFNVEQEYTLNEKYRKTSHHMYCNLNILCFLRTFDIFYSRLLRIKEQEGEAHEQIRRGLLPKPAKDLGLIDRLPSDFFYDVDPKANLYKQIVRMCEEVIRGDIDQLHMEETLRRFYMQSGYLLYNLDRILNSISKYVASIFTGDSRDRSSDIANLFFREREKEETTHAQEIQYRKQVEKLVKEGDVYRVTYIPSDHLVTIQVMTPEDTTLANDELSREARWSYYVTSYSMRDPTEGVSFSDMRMPFLKRNLPAKLDEDEEYDRFYRRLEHHDGLVHRICANNYTILYQPGTYDFFWRSNAPIPGKDADAETLSTMEEALRQEQATLAEKRRDRFREKFVNNPSWAKNLSKDSVDESNQRFRSWMDGALLPAEDVGSGEGVEKPAEPIPAKPEPADTEMEDAQPEAETAAAGEAEA